MRLAAPGGDGGISGRGLNPYLPAVSFKRWNELNDDGGDGGDAHLVGDLPLLLPLVSTR